MGRIQDPDAPNEVLGYFESWADYVAFAAKPKAERGSGSGMNDPDRTFYGINVETGRPAPCTFAEAQRLSLEGWREGRAKIREAHEVVYRGALHSLGTVSMPVMGTDLVGMLPSVPAYLSGDPAAMLTWQETSAPRPVIQIVIQMTYSAGTTAQQVYRRGAAICALVDLMEQRGARVEIVGALSNRGSNRGERDRHLDMHVTVKRPDQPLDLDLIAFVFAHPASFRRIGFAAEEQICTTAEQDIFGITSGTYGRAADSKEHRRGDLYMPTLDRSAGDFFDDAATEAWLIRVLREQGLEVPDALAS